MLSLFGITDPAIILGYVLSIGLAIACIVYGLLNWNREGVNDGN
ncbi:MAG: symporter small accessory protein [Methanobacteriota archaeon]